MTNDWRFTSDGEAEFFDCPHDLELHGKEMPGYRPGTVIGEIQESDLWQILVGTYFWMNAWHRAYNEPETAEGYVWKCEASTNFLYDQPWGPGFDSTTQRIVSGALAVVDELGWMGFSAVFSGEEMQYLILEVDSDWTLVASSSGSYSDQPTTWKIEGLE